MNLSNQIKRDKLTFRRLEGNKKWLFIWDYYKIPIISILVVLSIGVLLLVGLNKAKTGLYIVMVNTNSEIDRKTIPHLFEENGIDLAGRKTDVETNYTLRYDDITETDVETVQVLAVRFGIGDLDLFVANEAVFESYAVKDAFVDLSLFIPEELLKENEADLYRYKNTDGHEITGGLWIRKGSPLHNAGFYQEDVLIGAAYLAENLDNALDFIQQLLSLSA